jgi:hypothetical protein
MTKKITFGADHVKIIGPKADGGLSATFDTGGYQQHQIAELLKIPQNTAMTVTVEYGDIELSAQPEWMAQEIENEKALIGANQPTYGADQQPTS